MKIKFNIIKPFEPLFRGELAKKRLLIYYGGRGGGKSDQLTIYFLIQALKQKNINILVMREFGRSNANSLIANFRNWINILGLNNVFVEKKEPLLKIKATSIFCNATQSKIIFTGINDNTAMTIKSVAKIKYAWIEEANYLTENTYRILAPTIRANDSQIFMSLNPNDPNEFVWRELIGKGENDLTYIRRINYDENPFFPPVLELERRKDLNTLPRELYLHIWEGEPTNYNDMQVIDIDKIGRFDDTQKRRYSKIIIVIDSAFSTKASADYSVVSVFGKFENEIHLLRLERGHWDFNTLIEMLKSLYFWASEKYGSVNQILIEKKASGQSLIQEIQRLTTLQIKPVIPTTDKFTRLTEVIAHLELLKLPMSDNPLNYWINDFLKECKEFRADLKHAHDDQIDCMIYALKELCVSGVNWSDFNNKLDNIFNNRF